MKLLGLLLVIASCSTYFPPVRGQYTLTSKKHFMYSNMYVNPSNLAQEKDNLLISYDVIVKNIDTTSHPIDLTKSRIVIAKKEFPINCERFQKKDKSFELRPSAQTRIVCLATIAKAGFPRSDYQSIIEIPLDQELARFEYLLRAEDFE